MARHPRVDYHRLTAKEFLPLARGPYRLITNDMYVFPQDTAQRMVEFAGVLAADGDAIVTLKLRSGQRCRLMSHAFRILRRAYVVKRVKHLFFNQTEVTCWLRRR